MDGAFLSQYQNRDITQCKGEEMMSDDKYMETADKASKLFEDGFHCSQAVLSACAERFYEGDISSVVAAMSPFGGGIASSGNVCGCLSGAIAMIGLLMGMTEPSGRDGRQMWRISYKMVRNFESLTAEYGGMNCRDIAQVNWKDREDVKEFRKNRDGRRKRCHAVLKQTVSALCTLIDESSED
jgi:C_GCAxxG_C_C family probable redox protein